MPSRLAASAAVRKSAMRPRGPGPDVEFINIDEAWCFVNVATEPDARRGRDRDGGGRAPEDGGGRIPAGAGVGGNAVFAVAVMACTAWLFLFVVLLIIPPPGPRRGGGPGGGRARQAADGSRQAADGSRQAADGGQRTGPGGGQALGAGQGPGGSGSPGSGGEPPAVISLLTGRLDKLGFGAT